MPNKKKLEFNNIIQEFGFPVDIQKMGNTYRLECYDQNSELYLKAREFEGKILNEINRQDTEYSQYAKDIDEGSAYKRFQNIFLEYKEIFDSEVYLLQLGVLLEKDLSTKKQIEALLKKMRNKRTNTNLYR